VNILYLIGYVGPTVLLVVYSQLIIKWRMGFLGPLPNDSFDKILFLFKAMFDPYIASGFIAAFIGGMIWLVAISKIPLNVGFPAYYGLTFVLVIVGSAWFLNEPLTFIKLVGVALTLAGVIIGSLG